jgi:hypothetical protein
MGAEMDGILIAICKQKNTQNIKNIWLTLVKKYAGDNNDGLEKTTEG